MSETHRGSGRGAGECEQKNRKAVYRKKQEPMSSPESSDRKQPEAATSQHTHLENGFESPVGA